MREVEGGEVEVSEDVANLVERFRLVKDEHDAIKKKHDDSAAVTGERFNVFSILGMERTEMKHSAMLAELLNPNGSHAQGAVFLQLFIETLKLNFLSNVRLEDFQVTTEASRRGFGRIDILIENDNKNKKCVVIENKIDADGSWEQLGRYYDYAMKTCDNNDKRFRVIYLTLYGNAPEGDAPDDGGLKEKVLRVSHDQDIVQWLERCIKKMARVARVKETMLQYQSLLKKLTNQSMSQRLIMETNKFFSQPKNCKLVPDLEQAISEFKDQLKREFWKEIRKQFEDACKQFGTIVSEESKYKLYTELNTPDNAKIYLSVGMAFKGNGEIHYSFRVYDGENVLWKGYNDQEYIEKYKKYLTVLEEAGLKTGEDWCLGSKYYGDSNGHFQFGCPDKALIQKLVRDRERENIVAYFIDEIKYASEYLFNASKNIP